MLNFTTDDDAHWVDSVYLGPKGHTLGWTARYVAYAIGFVIWAVLVKSEALLGFPRSYVLVIVNVFAVVIITTAIGKMVDHDRPLLQQLRIAGHEITAPRTVPVPAPTEYAVDKITFTD